MLVKRTIGHQLPWSCYNLTSDDICCHISWSTLVQVKAFCVFRAKPLIISIMPYCVGDLGQHCFRWCLVALWHPLPPSHYLTQCWRFISKLFRNTSACIFCENDHSVKHKIFLVHLSSQMTQRLKRYVHVFILTRSIDDCIAKNGNIELNNAQ